MEDYKKIIKEANKKGLSGLSELEKIADVHTRHCCGEHKRCKYGDPNCTVVKELKLPDFPCNCEWM